MLYGRMNRQISEHDETIFRSVHHNFCGNSVAETARIMEISTASVYRALARVRKVVPSLFPILNKADAEILRNYNAGLCNEAISVVCRISLSAVKRKVSKLKERGIIVVVKPAKMLRYSSNMDNEVVEKF